MFNVFERERMFTKLGHNRDVKAITSITSMVTITTGG